MHKKVNRPWGSYKIIHKDKGYKIKMIEVKPHNRLSLQRHKHRSEVWFVLEGTAKIKKDLFYTYLSHNANITIPIGSMHRLINFKNNPLKVLEIQLGKYLEEDDIERFDDDYGRGVNERMAVRTKKMASKKKKVKAKKSKKKS